MQPAVCLTAPRKAVYRPPVAEPAAAPDKEIASPKSHHPVGWEPVDATDTNRQPKKLASAAPAHGGAATPWWEAPVAPGVTSAREWGIAGAPAEDGAASVSRPGSESPRSCGGEQCAAPQPMPQYQQQQSLEGLLCAPPAPHSAEARAAHAYEARLVKHLSHGQWTLLSLLGDRAKGCPMPPAVGLSLKAFIVARPHLFHLLWDGNQGTWRAKLRTKPLQAGNASPHAAASVAAMPAETTSVVPVQTAAGLDCDPLEQAPEPKAVLVAANPWRTSYPLPDCATVSTDDVTAPAMEPFNISGDMPPPAPTSEYGLFRDHPLSALGTVFNGHGGGVQPATAHMQHPSRSGASAYEVLCGPHRHSTVSLGGFSQAIAAASGAAETNMLGVFGGGARGPSTCFGDAAIRALASSAPSSPQHAQGRFAPQAGSAPLPCHEQFMATSAPATATGVYQPYFGCSDMGAAMARYMRLDASGGNAMGTHSPRPQAAPRVLPAPRNLGGYGDMPETGGMYGDRGGQRQREGDDDTDALLLECLSMGAH